MARNVTPDEQERIYELARQICIHEDIAARNCYLRAALFVLGERVLLAEAVETAQNILETEHGA